jgi:hypothetical protein
LIKKIKVQRLSPESAKIEQLNAARGWMDDTANKHAYMCFPMTLTNGLGWGISFNKDIRFIWDGVDTHEPDHVTILEGEEYAFTGRANATVSFRSGLIFKTDEDVSMLSMPVPNEFVRGAQAFTILMSTSFYKAELPLAMKITEPNIEICIPAGTPVAAVLPISVSGLENNFELSISEGQMPSEYWDDLRAYGDAAEAKNSVGDWSKMYRNAVNHDGTPMGNHETKKIKLKTSTCPVTGAVVESDN